MMRGKFLEHIFCHKPELTYKNFVFLFSLRLLAIEL